MRLVSGIVSKIVMLDYLVKIYLKKMFLSPFAFFELMPFCKFGHRKLPIKISRKLLQLVLLQLVASYLVNRKRMMNRLPGEKDGRQTNSWGLSVS